MNKIFYISLVFILSIFLSGCGDQTDTGGGGDYGNSDYGNDDNSNYGGQNQSQGNSMMGDAGGDDPMAMKDSGGGAGGDPMQLLKGDDSGKDGSIGGGDRFIKLGDVFAEIGGERFNYISAADTKHNQILMSVYNYNTEDGYYYVQIAAYDIRDDRLNPNAGYILIKYKIIDMSLRNPILIYPPSGTLEITQRRQLDRDYIISGTLSNASIVTENNMTVEGYAKFDEVHLVNLQANQ